jgi:hypothetical protein
VSDKSMIELREKLAAVLAEGVRDDAFAKIKKQIADVFVDVETDIDYRVKEDLAPNLAVYVQEMAERALKELLVGNEQAMRYYLMCQPGYWNGRDPKYVSVIHGRLHETDAIKLRREIAQAHADLIQNERIADLEAQVEGLTTQVAKLKADARRAWEMSR